MRGLAEYAMKGRRQAILAVLLCGLLPIVNYLAAAIVALVCLRKGWQEALIVVVWAILPAGGWAIAGDPIPLLLLAGTCCLAITLRETESWQLVLLGSIAIAVVTELSLRLIPGFLTNMVDQLKLALNEFNFAVQPGFTDEGYRQYVLAIYGLLHMVMSLVMLMLARRWQAQLYNPGGFQQEFHQLRIENKAALALTVLFILAINGVPVLRGWTYYFMVPLLVSGMALVHAIIGLKKLPKALLVIFYFVMMMPTMLLILVLLALIDSWYDFRKRIRVSN